MSQNAVPNLADDIQNLNVSEHGVHGGDTISSMGQSDTQSDNNLNQSSSAPNSSRGSTRATGEDDVSDSYIQFGERNTNYGLGRMLGPDNRIIYEDEQEKEEDGSPILTNKFLRDLFKKEHRKYYRTPSLNDKLFLHYKGFHKMKNLAQFTDLKCLYFEANGCDSLLGLEENKMMRSLFIQENCIEVMEGLENLKELRQLQLSDNLIRKVEGLGGCEQLDTLYLKRNRLGQNHEGSGDIECLKGLLDCPTITTLDISENYLADPAVLDEILFKMPQLRCLYSQGNKFCQNVSAYRKKVIVGLPDLKYLDDKPVFEEDRRRAEAYARGGIEAEREEIKKIKKEKDDKHWANHEAFMDMMKEAQEKNRKESESKGETKEEKKASMKEMMAKARESKETQLKKDGIFKDNNMGDENQDYFKEMQARSNQKYEDKQAGKEPTQIETTHDKTLVDELNQESAKEGAKIYDEKQLQEFTKSKEIEDKHIAEIEKKLGKGKKFVEIPEVSEDGPVIEDVPELEDVNEETRRLEELNKTKDQKHEEWLAQVVREQEESKSKQYQQFIDHSVKLQEQSEKKDQKTQDEVSDNQSQSSAVNQDDIDVLMDEKKVTEAMKIISKNEITERMEASAEAVSVPGYKKPQPEYTDYDELD